MKNSDKLLICVVAFAVGALLWNGGEEKPAPVDPRPVVTHDKFRALIVEESADRSQLPKSQLEILTSVKLRTWLKNNGCEYRIWDKDVDASHESKDWQALLATDRKSLPWIDVRGKKKFDGPLPSTVDATISLLEKSKP